MAHTETAALNPARAFASPSPRVLRVETGINNPREMLNDLFVTLLDYTAYKSVPRLLRLPEQRARLDFYLAWRARKMAQDYDIVWAGSEKVAVPLTLMGLTKPLVVTIHYPQARLRARLLQWLNVGRRWAAIGYISAADRDFLQTRLKVPASRLFPIQGIKLDRFKSAPECADGPIMSLGVTQRDYRTLITALETLPGYETEIYVSSRFGDPFRGQMSHQEIPAWVHFPKPVSDQELIERYQRARFVVVALEDTRQSSAGVNVILEACSSGKAVIATRTAGTPSYLIEGETGILVPPYDVSALRAAIETLWTRPELAQAMGRRGRSFVEQEFDPKKIDQGVRAMLLRVHHEHDSTH